MSARFAREPGFLASGVVVSAVDSAGGGGALRALGPEAVLERLYAGDTVYDVAKSCGVSEVSVYGYLLRHVPDEWKAHSVAGALKRLHDAQAELDDAGRTPEQVDVSRAAARVKSAQWYLERLCAKHFGDAGLKGVGGVQVNVYVNREGVSSAVRVSGMGALSGEFSDVTSEEGS